MDKTFLYSQVYKILQTTTPLAKDCGKLCNKACCQGATPESGMYLYPGEQELQSRFGAKNNFLQMHSINFENTSLILAVCNGECIRAHRPLACRIFPLVPYLDSKKNLTIKMDPRAVSLCPLARTLTISELKGQFVLKVREAFHLLIKDPDIQEFIIWQSHLLDEYQDLKNRFLSP